MTLSLISHMSRGYAFYGSCLVFFPLRYQSLPVTLRTLYSKLEEITSAPVSPSRPAATKAVNDHLSPSDVSAMDTNGALTTFSQSAAVSEDSFSVSSSACYAAMPVAQS